MSVLDAVPGAEELTRAARLLAGLDLAAPDGMRADLAGVADGLVTTTAAVRPVPDGAWSGRGAAAFGAWADAFARTGASTEPALRAAAGELERLVAGLRGAAREVDDQVTLAAEAVARVRHAAGPGGPEPGALRAAVAGAAAAARAVIARVEQELADAAARLRGHTAALVGFSRLPAPDPGGIAADAPSSAAAATGVQDIAGGRSAHAASAGGHYTPDDPAGVPVRPADDLVAPVVPGEPGALAAPLVPAPAAPSPDAGAGPSAGAAPAPGGVAGWIHAAREVLLAAGVPAEKMDPGAIATIIDHESGGDPGAVNGGDANAARGTPSQGLMQTIGPTFTAYRLPGHDDIRDPVDNIIAGVRYAIARYGSVSRVPGVVAVAHGRAYVGY